jgi:hypothetical protein
MLRAKWNDIDKDELFAWVASLPITASSKSLALRMLRIRNDDGTLTFADRLQEAAGMWTPVETALTLDDVTKWFADNPEGTLEKFLEEQEDAIFVDKTERRERYYYGGLSVSEQPDENFLPHVFVRALLRSDTSEGNSQVRDLVKRLWKRNPQIVELAIQKEYEITGYSSIDHYGTDINSLPEYIFDLLLLEEGGAAPKADWASGLSASVSPKAGELLEKWVKEAGAATKPRIERCLEIWQIRNALRQKRMEFYRDIVAGRKHPDELLLSQPSWIWQDGRYVPKD